jgi:hypothetical protein
MFTSPMSSNGRGADHIENSLSIVEACLLSRCLAMGIHVTVLNSTYDDADDFFCKRCCYENIKDTSDFVKFPSRFFFFIVSVVARRWTKVHTVLHQVIQNKEKKSRNWFYTLSSTRITINF